MTASYAPPVCSAATTTIGTRESPAPVRWRLPSRSGGHPSERREPLEEPFYLLTRAGSARAHVHRPTPRRASAALSQSAHWHLLTPAQRPQPGSTRSLCESPAVRAGEPAAAIAPRSACMSAHAPQLTPVCGYALIAPVDVTRPWGPPASCRRSTRPRGVCHTLARRGGSRRDSPPLRPCHKERC